MQILGVSMPFGISLLVGFLCGWVSFLVLPIGGALGREAMVSAEVGDEKAMGRGGEKDEKGNREGNDNAHGKQISRQNVVDQVKSRKLSSSPSLTRECNSEGSPSAHSGGNGAPCNEAKVSEMANGMDTSGNDALSGVRGFVPPSLSRERKKRGEATSYHRNLPRLSLPLPLPLPLLVPTLSLPSASSCDTHTLTIPRLIYHLEMYSKACAFPRSNYS